MEPEKHILMTGFFILIPGIYLLWFSLSKLEFYQKKKWENWGSYAGLLAMLFIPIDKIWGVAGVRFVFVLFSSVMCLTGLWILSLVM